MLMDHPDKARCLISGDIYSLANSHVAGSGQVRDYLGPGLVV